MKYFLAIFAFLTSSFNFLAKGGKTVLVTQVTPTASVAPSESPIPTHRVFRYFPNPTFVPRSIIDDFPYPGAHTISQTSSILSLQSSDDPQTIINWYESKINGNFSDRSDNVSNTNGNVNATLSASGSSERINITITKSAGELYTTIDLKIKSQ